LLASRVQTFRSPNALASVDSGLILTAARARHRNSNPRGWWL